MVTKAQAGDRAAQSTLFRRFAPAVHGCALAYVSPSEAQDTVQDVFETVLNRLGQLRDPSAFPGWIMAITRRCALERAVRLQRARSDGSAVDELTHDSPGAEKLVEVSQTLQALHALPDRFREVLVLRLVEGMTGPEIADATGLSHGTVRVYLHTGMQLLRVQLGIGNGSSDERA